MHVLDANELFGITSYTFDRIMEVGWRIWPDAFALYFKLMKQARMQQTNQTYSLNEFLKKGMWRWEDRLRNAKNILKQLGLVEDVKIQDEQWKIKWHYIRVNYLIDENKVRNSVNTYNLSITGVWPGMDETQCRETTTSGWTDANALSTKGWNAWSTKKEKEVEELKKKLEVEYQLPQKVIELAITFDNYKAWPKIRKFDKGQLTRWVNKLKKDGLECEEWMLATLEKSIASWYIWTTPIKPREIKKKDDKPSTIQYH